MQGRGFGLATAVAALCSTQYSHHPNSLVHCGTSLVELIHGILEKETYLALSDTDLFAGENYAFTCLGTLSTLVMPNTFTAER